MKDSCYLTLTSNGIRKMTKSEPSLDPGEIAVRVRVDVDNVHFRRPHAEARLTIGEQQLLFPLIDVQLDALTDVNVRPSVDAELPG